ncbi:cyclic nucleotide-binding domain-containing protein [Nocardioides piscis]|uniref:Cyclic nucleotide-binding domain-containing protein n=1 Tax=Nocardioides piscis TaxID=2714938 RepID=A0A6G7YDG2_9ACTN|nr:cyclic nucleotide-binding domain-containing protein [Nocardioides piscis]QIK74833.1 cyclic nucleotide-binding domain-containing protein [Nocardioides piscis]
MTTSIFDALPAADADKVTAAGTPVSLPQGWSPIGEKTLADKAYILTSGEVSVRSKGTEIAILGPGQIIGEAGIINKKLRTATIVALTPLQALHYTREQLTRLIDEIPSLAAALEASAAERYGNS